mmetsp:Transcript_42501/g.62250  ORF Transcript_42501/g.62250 Transcript_42501/m.62250 type:complete len:94 (+) Transcript_42501:305-586(+)
MIHPVGMILQFGSNQKERDEFFILQYCRDSALMKNFTRNILVNYRYIHFDFIPAISYDGRPNMDLNFQEVFLLRTNGHYLWIYLGSKKDSISF